MLSSEKKANIKCTIFAIMLGLSPILLVKIYMSISEALYQLMQQQ